MVAGKEYASMTEAAKEHGISGTHMARLIQQGKNVKAPRAVRDHLLNAEYASIHNAAKAHGMKVREFEKYMKIFPLHFELKAMPNNKNLNWTHASYTNKNRARNNQAAQFNAWVQRQLYGE
jgi:hypothetical protein